MRVALLAFAFLWFTGVSGAEPRVEIRVEVSVQALPPEARATLALIKAGGPFPYAQDGRVFSNREKLLPIRDRGYYREYTVNTLGARDRGARRIVAGSGGEYYYTADHYRSFQRILE